VLLDHAEDNLFAIERELAEERHVAPSMLAAVLADCKEEERLREVFAEYRPTVVFHAAAYKHVGLMEANPVEAVRNNALATRVVAHVAGELGATRFVLVSTDKAVAPATVMGASKALAEFALEASTARFPETCYAAVRFGNVLGSSGSVVPIFRRQIERGGPVTVTDERMTRYFMTIPEAVQLIIRSGALACERREAGSAAAAQPAAAEVFVLDMGEPVRILELARAMIELSGLDPESDIEVEVVGRRPGEKLHEQLFNSYERARETTAEKILLAERPPLGAAAVESIFAEIGLLVLEGDAAGLAAKVAELSALHVEAGSTANEPDAAVVAGPHENPHDAPAALIHSPDS
jgi:FlaA1/EpsC-like NDP-sugar epimerase